VRFFHRLSGVELLFPARSLLGFPYPDTRRTPARVHGIGHSILCSCSAHEYGSALSSASSMRRSSMGPRLRTLRSPALPRTPRNEQGPASLPHSTFLPRAGNCRRSPRRPASHRANADPALADEQKPAAGLDGTAPFPRLRRLNPPQNPETLHIRRLENGLERPRGRSRPAPRHLASLVGVDAFVGELTRGNIRTISATIKIENTQRYREVLWLGDLDSNQD
jgi:hypothetical protein